MMIYADPSAFVKLWLEEEHSSSIRELLQGSDTAIVCSTLGRVEMFSALKRAYLGRRLTGSQFAKILRELRGVWQRVAVVKMTEDLVQEACDQALRFGLRGYDAVHLAAILYVMRQGVSPLLLSFDDELCRAARKSGILLVEVVVVKGAR
jgi:predicted nucleic acid-binding protein